MNEDATAPHDVIARCADCKSTAELQSLLDSRPDGLAQALDAALRVLVSGFAPDKAGEGAAVVQYDVVTPGGTVSCSMTIGGGRCQAAAAPADAPQVSIRIGLLEFFRMMAGRLSSTQAFLMGKMKVSGDMALAARITGWFN